MNAVRIFHRGLTLLLVLGAAALLFTACSAVRSADSAATAEWREWRAKRLESIAGTNGWATLVGLLWLHEGTNTLGSDPANDLRLPIGRAPKVAGIIIRSGTQARFVAAPGLNATLDGKPVTMPSCAPMPTASNSSHPSSRWAPCTSSSSSAARGWPCG